MQSSDCIYLEKRINLLRSIDMCLILKLLESTLEKKLPDSEFFFWQVESERLTYDAYWYGFLFLFEHSLIGTASNDGHVFYANLHSLTELKQQFHSFEPIEQEEIESFLSQWERKRMTVKNEHDFQGFMINPTNYELTGVCTDQPFIHWYPHCKDLIELDVYCKFKLKELLINGY